MKFIKKIIRVLLLIVVLIGALLVYKGYNLYKVATKDVDLKTKIDSIKEDKDYVKFDILPEYYVKAVVDVEDHRFYKHCGIDIISIGRAVVNNFREKAIVEGGSTITQQLAKNMYFTQKKEIVRKIAELFVVYDLEKNYTKDEILELYVNTSYFGDGYYGIGEAANGYFGKEVKDMNLSESTLLAGIPNAPSAYVPTKNPNLAKERQIQVINKMVKLEHLTKEQADELQKELD